MADDAILFRARAATEQANAEAASLDNVRERATRAAQAWNEMADRAERTLALRTKRDEEAATKAAERHLMSDDLHSSEMHAVG